MICTIAEYAEQHKVSRRTIQRLIHQGRLPALNLGVGRRCDFRIDSDLADQALRYTPPAPPPLSVRRPSARRSVSQFAFV